MAPRLSIAGTISPQNIESLPFELDTNRPKKSPEGKDLCWAAVQQSTRTFSHRSRTSLSWSMPFQNVADGTDLLCPAVLNGLSEKFHLLGPGPGVVLQQHLKASTLENRLGYRLHGFAERLEFLIARVVEGARSLAHRSAIGECLPPSKATFRWLSQDTLNHLWLCAAAKTRPANSLLN